MSLIYNARPTKRLTPILGLELFPDSEPVPTSPPENKLFHQFRQAFIEAIIISLYKNSKNPKRML